MSNPSGTDRDDTAADDAAVGRAAVAAEATVVSAFDDSDPVTEVIDVWGDAGANPGPADPATGERRYTAPGFDANFTQVIDRVPDAPTEFITTGAAPFTAAGLRDRSTPQAIPPRRTGGRRTRRVVLGLLAVALLTAAIVGGIAYKRNADRVAAENSVRSSIETFDRAIRDGDLATLRGITCGETKANYANYDDTSWTDTYSKILAAKQYPVVAGVDEIVVNGDHAEANVTSYMAFDPDTKSTRSFDLQFRDDQWKICQSS